MSSELEDAARRLRALADTIKPWHEDGTRAIWVTTYELDAIIYAAAFLGVFVESLEDPETVPDGEPDDSWTRVAR